MSAAPARSSSDQLPSGSLKQCGIPSNDDGIFNIIQNMVPPKTFDKKYSSCVSINSPSEAIQVNQGQSCSRASVISHGSLATTTKVSQMLNSSCQMVGSQDNQNTMRQQAWPVLNSSCTTIGSQVSRNGVTQQALQVKMSSCAKVGSNGNSNALVQKVSQVPNSHDSKVRRSCIGNAIKGHASQVLDSSCSQSSRNAELHIPQECGSGFAAVTSLSLFNADLQNPIRRSLDNSTSSLSTCSAARSVIRGRSSGCTTFSTTSEVSQGRNSVLATAFSCDTTLYGQSSDFKAVRSRGNSSRGAKAKMPKISVLRGTDMLMSARPRQYHELPLRQRGTLAVGRGNRLPNAWVQVSNPQFSRNPSALNVSLSSQVFPQSCSILVQQIIEQQKNYHQTMSASPVSHKKTQSKGYVGCKQPRASMVSSATSASSSIDAKIRAPKYSRILEFGLSPGSAAVPSSSSMNVQLQHLPFSEHGKISSVPSANSFLSRVPNVSSSSSCSRPMIKPLISDPSVSSLVKVKRPKSCTPKEPKLNRSVINTSSTFNVLPDIDVSVSAHSTCYPYSMLSMFNSIKCHKSSNVAQSSDSSSRLPHCDTSDSFDSLAASLKSYSPPTVPLRNQPRYLTHMQHVPTANSAEKVASISQLDSGKLTSTAFSTLERQSQFASKLKTQGKQFVPLEDSSQVHGTQASESSVQKSVLNRKRPASSGGSMPVYRKQRVSCEGLGTARRFATLLLDDEATEPDEQTETCLEKEVITIKKKGKNIKGKEHGAHFVRKQNQLHSEIKLENVEGDKVLKQTEHSKKWSMKKPFVQRLTCSDRSMRTVIPCLECRRLRAGHAKKKHGDHQQCRFLAFRRLRVRASGKIQCCGFMAPSDCRASEVSLWLPPSTKPTDPEVDVPSALYIIQNVGSGFCDLMEQEKEATSWIKVGDTVAWKRAVEGVREMCDACCTTMFNMHWTCAKCGHAICLDCYRSVVECMCRSEAGGEVCNSCSRILVRCNVTRYMHSWEALMATQIIPSDAMCAVARAIHEVRRKFNLKDGCPCGESLSEIDDVHKSALSKTPDHQLEHTKMKNELSGCDDIASAGPVGILPVVVKSEPVMCEAMCPTVASLNPTSASDPPSDTVHPVNCGVEIPVKYRDTVAPPQVMAKHDSVFDVDRVQSPKNDDQRMCSSCSNVGVAACCSEFVENHEVKPNIEAVGHSKIVQAITNKKLQHEVFRDRDRFSQVKEMKRGVSTIMQSTPNSIDVSPAYVEAPHNYLDDGRLLQLLDPSAADNLRLFRQEWSKSHPVLVSNCDKKLDAALWNPQSFSAEFGDKVNDLVDCARNIILQEYKMKHFWDGFECVGARLRDRQNRPMILKLKDWPPTDDFADILPSRFSNLLGALPLPEYTDRKGVFNLASRLPAFFVRPDLGPKMYNAYGSALSPHTGSTNLHLDISDAVNVLLYVGIPNDEYQRHTDAALVAIKEAGCCSLSQQRIHNGKLKPGALWHIFDPQDSNKIRDLLRKVGLERNQPVEPNHDPIHDQSWYLDEELRDRLWKEYHVRGYTILQCLGDAIFIPAGAPHQVRNLHSCIKAAEDFVSPENLHYCFKLTQEFRYLSDTHSNHEDKLQVKNIIFHTVKDVVSVLLSEDSSQCLGTNPVS